MKIFVSSNKFSVCFQLGICRHRAPEVLFNPELIGEESESIHDVLLGSIQKSDMDLRRTLYQNVVLAGGSTLFRGRFLVFVEILSTLELIRFQVSVIDC